MANVKELKRVRTHIRRYPEKLNMSVWASQTTECGTTACIAGRAMLLNGWSFSEYEFTDAFGVSAYEGENNGCFEEGRKILGLSYSEAQTLFSCADDQVDRLLTDLIEGRPI